MLSSVRLGLLCTVLCLGLVCRSFCLLIVLFLADLLIVCVPRLLNESYAYFIKKIKIKNIILWRFFSLSYF
jgi:hypothetical protein